MEKNKRILGVIPARYASSRFPGKPLADICGKPMVWWVYMQAMKVSEFSGVYVATDDERISEVLIRLKIPFIMTSDKHKTAANRLFEVSKNYDADYFIAINGDEPLIDPGIIKAAIPDEIPQDVEFGTNIITDLSDAAQVIDPANIKVAFDNTYRALYMSRSPIPFPYNSINYTFYKHVGVLGYNKKMLEFYDSSVPGTFESVEGIDTMRFIDYGKILKFIFCQGVETLSVDMPKDLDIVREIIKKEIL